VLADDGVGRARSLVCGQRRGSRQRCVACTQAARAEVVSVGLSVAEEQRILDAHARTNWGPMRLAAVTGRHRATVWKALKRRCLAPASRHAPDVQAL
jgi:transcriptional regulator of acetoin/glycerol metabolism